MSADSVFGIASLVVLPAWILLAAASTWRWTEPVVRGMITLLALVYLALVVLYLPEAQGGFSSLAAVSQLFSNPYLLLAGWIHYLAFDLFVGSWQVGDARRLGISRLAVVPCLVFTFLLGPIGWLCYLMLRAVIGQQPGPEEASGASA